MNSNADDTLQLQLPKFFVLDEEILLLIIVVVVAIIAVLSYRNHVNIRRLLEYHKIKDLPAEPIELLSDDK